MKFWTHRNNGTVYESPRQVMNGLLEDRGLLDEDSVYRFLQPRLRDLSDPCRLPDMDRAVKLVDEALRLNEPILVFSDYDVDGMSSGALLYRFLVEMGGDVDVIIPKRFTEGYGLSIPALERAIEPKKPKLFFCLDCGTTNYDEVNWLKEQGIPVIILDHHELAEKEPPAEAFVNPQRGERDHDLATVGLVFKFCHAFLKTLGQPDQFDLKAHLDLVALGTISDLVPLRGDNRILVHYGLKQLAETHHIGLQELMKVAGVKNKPVPSTVGFLLGPRLNASGRLTSAKEGWRLLTTQDSNKARSLALSLDQLNRQRQKVEQDVYAEAREKVDSFSEDDPLGCVVVSSRDWHQGVIGIVASRLQRLRYRPAIVISIDEEGRGKGSGRSIKGCSLMDALRDCREHLQGFGGHAMAAGLEIEESSIEDFTRAINDWFLEHVDDSVFKESLTIDVQLPGRLLVPELAKELNKMEPFGQSNAAPVFSVENVEVVGKPRHFGKNHVRFRGEAEGMRFDVVAFGMCQGGMPARKFDLAGHWEMDSYTKEPCFRVMDWRW
ncbi:MAG: single-stranded-DNA-specific exonuclease RecJ [Verrucomicrobiota bacterium]